MKKILSIVNVFVIVLLLALSVGCGSKSSKSDTNTSKESNTAESKSVIDDESIYYLKINGKKYKVGDKISKVLDLGYHMDSDVEEEKLDGNKYMINGGEIYKDNEEKILYITPYNPTSSTLTMKNLYIGGFGIGFENSYDDISEEILNLDYEIYGGIKLGSSSAKVEKVFGEPDRTYEASDNSYKTYTYDSSEEVYREFRFTIDKNDKVSSISFKNMKL